MRWCLPRLNFSFLNTHTHTHTHAHTQSREVQRDGGSLHFMWVQCRQENKSVCAPIADSPDFCHSSQGEMSSGGIQNNNKAINFKVGKHTQGSHWTPQSVRPSACARLLFNIPRFPKQKSCPGLDQRVAEKFGGREGNGGGKRCSVTLTSQQTGAGLNESLEINKIPPRVHCTVDNFVSFFLPPK